MNEKENTAPTHLNISVNINALGCCSGDCIRVPLQDIRERDGVDVAAYFPPLYHPYIKRIEARPAAGGGVEITSSYGNCTLVPGGPAFTIRGIGLSYACCDLDLSVPSAKDRW